jgi:hypothetical protein
MKPGAKRTLVARLMAGAGCIYGVLGFTMAPSSQMAGQAQSNWLEGGILLMLFATYLIIDGAAAFQKSQS